MNVERRRSRDAGCGKTQSFRTMFQVTAASLGGVVLGLALRQTVDEASASHPKNPHSHVISINSYAEFETYCVWALDNSITQPDALQRIRTIDDSRWADIRWVEFAGDEIPCLDNPSPEDGDYLYRTYFYTAADIDNWSTCFPRPGEHIAGCARTRGPQQFDPASQHNEWPAFEIDLRTGSLTGDYGSRLVNHEVGHALGLADDQEDTACAVPSIMHGPKLWDLCSDVPTDADAATVLALEPGGSTGGGGFAGKYFGL